MRSLSTHVLDAVSGNPASEVTVSLCRRTFDGTWSRLSATDTDADGRVRELVPQGLEPGDHRLVFDTAAYFAATGQIGFYPEVAITFSVTDERHHHVPLLLSPSAYSTYRGS